MIVLDQVTVTRGSTCLLDRVSAELPAGHCTAVVGPSGAGKSTLLRLLNRLDDPTSGHITLDGVSIMDLDVLALRRRVGLVGLPATAVARATAELSGGEAQRVCLARALAVGPEVLLLDEPTSALDGVNAALVADLARRHVTTGGTVLLVSHDLAVVRDVADQVLVLDHGRLVAAGRPDEIDYLEAG